MLIKSAMKSAHNSTLTTAQDSRHKASVLFVMLFSVVIVIAGLGVALVSMQLNQNALAAANTQTNGRIAGIANTSSASSTAMLTGTNVVSGDSRICTDTKANIQITVPSNWNCNTVEEFDVGTFGLAGNGISFAFNYGVDIADVCGDSALAPNCTSSIFFENAYLKIVYNHNAGENYYFLGEGKNQINVDALEINYEIDQSNPPTEPQKQLILQILQSVKPLN